MKDILYIFFTLLQFTKNNLYIIPTEIHVNICPSESNLINYYSFIDYYYVSFNGYLVSLPENNIIYLYEII